MQYKLRRSSQLRVFNLVFHSPRIFQSKVGRGRNEIFLDSPYAITRNVRLREIRSNKKFRCIAMHYSCKFSFKVWNLYIIISYSLFSQEWPWPTRHRTINLRHSISLSFCRMNWTYPSPLPFFCIVCHGKIPSITIFLKVHLLHFFTRRILRDWAKIDGSFFFILLI